MQSAFILVTLYCISLPMATQAKFQLLGTSNLYDFYVY